MTVTPVERVRSAITEKLQEYAGRQIDSLRETILIQNGLFCGRKFQAEGYEVVWFLEEDELKFFGPTGELLLASHAIGIVESSKTPDTSIVLSDRRAA